MKTTFSDIDIFKRKALKWASSFDTACYFDSNGFSDKYSSFDLLIAAGKTAELKASAGEAFEQLQHFKNANPGWLPGFFTYDLKNETENNLASEHPDYLNFPELYFFVPKHILLVKGETVEIISGCKEEVLSQINEVFIQCLVKQEVSLTPRFSKDEYLQAIVQLKEHIKRGDIYEANFCQEFFSDYAHVDPLAVFEQLNSISPTPFACFFKLDEKYILSASPERFLAKRERKLISQPIKGTAKREANPLTDLKVLQQLHNDPKEQAENVMIVDLVRNDLTKSALAGSVQVEELFGIYSFTQVHQMISTIVASLHPQVSALQAIARSFPMGSMTGAPKVKAMQLIEQYERSRRGVYSGAIGYFSPDDDFDFNVVIRTILYNADKKYLSLHVGSAITYQSDPEQEYEECLIKASAVMEILNRNDN
jgi:para-aminobenzoate synthetase component 1